MRKLNNRLEDIGENLLYIFGIMVMTGGFFLIITIIGSLITGVLF